MQGHGNKRLDRGRQAQAAALAPGRPTRERPRKRSFAAGLPLMGLLALSGCVTTPPALNPFGLPYEEQSLFRDHPLTHCTPKDVDKPPRLVFGSRPHYPAAEMLSGRSGDATIRFTVSETGQVDLLDTVADNRWFAAHARLAMRDWKMEPAERSGAGTRSECEMKFIFAMGLEVERLPRDKAKQP